jgi:hypothetical protein
MNKLEIIYDCIDYNEHYLFNNEITSRFIADNIILNSNLYRIIIYQYNNSKTIYKGNSYKNIISGIQIKIKKVWL